MKKCKLSMEEQRVFIEIWRLGKESGREWGLAYCNEGGNVIPHKLCRGDQCSLTIERCPDGSKFSDVHMHPKNDLAAFSYGDIKSSLKYDMHRSCVIAETGDYLCAEGYNRLSQKRKAHLDDDVIGIIPWTLGGYMEEVNAALREYVTLCEGRVDEV